MMQLVSRDVEAAEALPLGGWASYKCLWNPIAGGDNIHLSPLYAFSWYVVGPVQKLHLPVKDGKLFLPSSSFDQSFLSQRAVAL